MCTDTHECPEDGTMFKCDTVIQFGNRSTVHQGVANGTVHSRTIWED